MNSLLPISNVNRSQSKKKVRNLPSLNQNNLLSIKKSKSSSRRRRRSISVKQKRPTSPFTRFLGRKAARPLEMTQIPDTHAQRKLLSTYQRKMFSFSFDKERSTLLMAQEISPSECNNIYKSISNPQHLRTLELNNIEEDARKPLQNEYNTREFDPNSLESSSEYYFQYRRLNHFLKKKSHRKKHKSSSLTLKRGIEKNKFYVPRVLRDLNQRGLLPIKSGIVRNCFQSEFNTE